MLTMTPNYEDYSCQFSFGQAPLPQAEDDVFSIPCFQDCPSKKQHRRQDQCHGIEATQQDALSLWAWAIHLYSSLCYHLTYACNHVDSQVAGWDTSVLVSISTWDGYTPVFNASCGTRQWVPCNTVFNGWYRNLRTWQYPDAVTVAACFEWCCVRAVRCLLSTISTT